MAAIARRIAVGLLISSFLCWSAPAQQDRPAEVRALVSSIATALSSGDAAEAMRAFGPSYSELGRLRGYFETLASSYAITNEVDVIDEQDSDTDSKVTLNWALTLTDLVSDASEHREGEIHARVIVTKDGLKVVEFSPINLFDPLKQRRSKGDGKQSSDGDTYRALGASSKATRPFPLERFFFLQRTTWPG
jgi:hypothetical protein